MSHSLLISRLLTLLLPINNQSVLDLLLSSGANLKSSISMTFEWSDEMRNITPLHIAASVGHTYAVDKLLSHGCDPLAVTDSQYTPLHLASMTTCLPTVVKLVEAKADVDLKTKGGSTCFYISATEMKYQGEKKQKQEQVVVGCSCTKSVQGSS